MITPLRDIEKHKRAELSVQASEHHYSIPRANGAPIDHYTNVEVAIFTDAGMVRPSAVLPRLYRFLPFLPYAREARSLDRMFEDGGSPVAGYVSQSDLHRIREYLNR